MPSTQTGTEDRKASNTNTGLSSCSPVPVGGSHADEWNSKKGELRCCEARGVGAARNHRRLGLFSRPAMKERLAGLGCRETEPPGLMLSAVKPPRKEVRGPRAPHGFCASLPGANCWSEAELHVLAAQYAIGGACLCWEMHLSRRKVGPVRSWSICQPGCDIGDSLFPWPGERPRSRRCLCVSAPRKL